MSGGVGDAFGVAQEIDAGVEAAERRHAGTGVLGGFPTQRGADGAAATAAARETVALTGPADRLARATVDRRDRGAWLRRYGLALEVALAVVFGLAVTAATSHLVAVAGVLAIWALSSYHAGRAVTSPLARQLRTVVNSAMPALAFAGVAVGFLSMPAGVLREALPAVVAASVVSACFRAVRWKLQSPVRVVAVGDRVGVAQAIEKFAGSPGSEVVGAVIVEADISPSDVDQDMFQVPVALGLAEAAPFTDRSGADLVVVTPGPGFTSLDLKRLHHTLQDLPVAVGVMGVLDSVAPHRVRAGWVANSTIIDVRAPRPSGWIRFVKSAADRVASLLLLAVSGIPLLVLMALVKLDSRGPAIFKQTRVGRDGRHFTVYKLRTMVAEAEEIKVDLSADTVTDSLLFKMREDPRITRVGRLLRRYSLDELPQLVNVLKGEMSLVGPRPFLPEETALMDADAMRRLAVAPGITGLWQVGGRSDLGWEQSAWLDVYYADNWSLMGDLKILMATVPAVFGARGAY
jgi:exopolysaccharide biosynthesis polyprenyl glycosylphosphotransferase